MKTPATQKAGGVLLRQLNDNQTLEFQIKFSGENRHFRVAVTRQTV